MESTLKLNEWSFKATGSTSTAKTKSTAVRCKGITKVGARCKRKTTNLNGYYWQHQNQVKGAVLKQPVTKDSDANVTVYNGILTGICRGKNLEM